MQEAGPSRRSVEGGVAEENVVSKRVRRWMHDAQRGDRWRPLVGGEGSQRAGTEGGGRVAGDDGATCTEKRTARAAQGNLELVSASGVAGEMRGGDSMAAATALEEGSLLVWKAAG